MAHLKEKWLTSSVTREYLWENHNTSTVYQAHSVKQL